jgi:hypothetical protein
MSRNECTDECTSEASNSSKGKGVTLQPTTVFGGLKTDVIDQNGVLNNISKANKKVRAKKPKVKKSRSATGSANNRKTKRRKKVGNSDLKVLSNKSGTKITDKSKQNLESPWQSYDGSNLSNFASAEASGFNEEEPEHNTWQNQIEAKQKIQHKQENSFFEELNDLLVLDSLK